MIMNCIRKLLMIRKPLMQSPANGTPSPEQQRIQKFYSLLLRIRIKPQQLLLLTMSGTCLGEKRLSAWMKKSWIFSGLNTLHGTASKTCVAQRTSNLPRGSNLHCSKPNMPSFEVSFTTTQTLRPQNQPGKRWYLAAGSSWDDLQSMPLRATVLTTWTRGWSFFWAEDRSALWAMVRSECDVAPVQNTTRRTEKQQMQSRIHKVATLARTGEKGRALAAARNAPPVPVNLFKKSRAFILRIQSHRHQRQLQFQPCSCLKLLSRSLLRSERCLDSVNQELSA